MGRKHSCLRNKVLTMVLMGTFLTQGVATNGIMVRAEEYYETYDLLGTEESKVSNPIWKEGSIATASWDAFEGANYYEVEVSVFYNNELVGIVTTGTTDTEVDVQQEIYKAIGDKYEDIWVQVTFNVTACYKDGDQSNVLSEKSDEASETTYKTSVREELPDYHFEFDTETLTVTWDKNDIVKPTFIISSYNDDFELFTGIILEDNVEEKDGRYYYDLRDWFESIYIPKESLDIHIEITLYTNTGYLNRYKPQKHFNLGDFVYETALKQRTDTNFKDLNIEYDKETCTFSWDSCEEARYVVFSLDIKGENGEYNGQFGGYDCEYYGNQERNRYCIADEFEKYYIPEETVTITPGIVVYIKDEYKNIYKRDPSIYLESFTYNTTIEQREKIQKDYHIEYDKDTYTFSLDKSKEVETLLCTIYIEDDNGYSNNKTFVWRKADQPDEEWEKESYEGIRYSFNVEDFFKALVIPAEKTKMTWKIMVSIDTNYNARYLDQFEIWLDPFYWQGVRNAVKKIIISPSNPVIYKGNSYYLGKQIEPTDAYYDKITWTSDNEGVVKVSGEGLITAVTVGDANITAKIDEVSCTVSVKVYEIASNLEKEEDKQLVADEAGKVLDDIVSSEEPDLSKTDIVDEEVGELKKEVQDAIIRGDEIYTDLIEDEKSVTEINDSWDVISEEYATDNIEFAGAYDVEIEMYYTDGEGEDHHIGNIVELDSEVEFTLPLPESIQESKEGEENILVRVHDGIVEELNVTINDDGTFTTRSDKYSDFVWVKRISNVHIHGGDNAIYHKAVAATCEKAGNSAYYSCSCGKYFSDKACTKEINKDSWVINATGHNYGKASYKWSSDYKTVTGTRVCKNDASHTDTEKVTTTYEIIKKPTETSTGIGRYTAVFTKEGFTTQTKDVEIDKLEPEVPPSKGDVTKKFTDVLENEWYVPAIQFVYDRAIMNGVSGTSFGTKGTLTREQFITVLYNLEGSPEITFKKYFDDVTDETSWYAKSVTWAAENGITSGVGDNKFGTGKEITREQLATLLYNYAQKKDEYKLSIDENAVANFSDANKIDSWASDGMKWAITNGVMSGKKGKDGQLFLDPLGKATRAECAQMIKNLKENAVK